MRLSDAERAAVSAAAASSDHANTSHRFGRVDWLPACKVRHRVDCRRLSHSCTNMALIAGSCVLHVPRHAAPKDGPLLYLMLSPACRAVLTASEWERCSMGRGSMVRLRRFAAKLLAGRPVTVGAHYNRRSVRRTQPSLCSLTGMVADPGLSSCSTAAKPHCQLCASGFVRNRTCGAVKRTTATAPRLGAHPVRALSVVCRCRRGQRFLGPRRQGGRRHRLCVPLLHAHQRTRPSTPDEPLAAYALPTDL